MIADFSGTSLRFAGSPVARRDRDWSHLTNQLSTRAQEVVCEAFPEHGLKRFRSLPWFSYHGLSRARGGSNCPLWRLAVWIVALRALGIGREAAQLLVDFLQSVINLVYAPSEVDIRAASDAEQEWEGRETRLQMLVMQDLERGELHRVPDYLAAARQEIAAQSTLIQGLESLLISARRAAPAGGR